MAAITAATIDCDGSISIIRQRINRSSGVRRSYRQFVYYLLISVQQNDGRLIDFLSGCWGGQINRETRYSGFDNGQTYTWKWKVKDDKAEMVLRRCVKYLHIKKEKALNGLRFISFKKRMKKLYPGSKSYPIYIWDKYEEFYNESKKLIKDIRDSKAGIETERQKRKCVSDSPNLQEEVIVRI